MEEEHFDIFVEVYPALLLTLTFVFLKCGGVIDWSWVWIFTPMYIYVGIVLIFIIIFLVMNFVFSHKNKGGMA